ncbi:MAG: hypothetical protein R2755_33985 [Acidimicrobiales bacterium]
MLAARRAGYDAYGYEDGWAGEELARRDVPRLRRRARRRGHLRRGHRHQCSST